MRISGLLLGGLLVAMPSHGFLIQTVESRFGNQVQQTWLHPDRIPFALHAAGSDDLSPTLTHALIRESFQVWSDVPTARVDFVDQDTTRSVPRQRDGRNLIYFDETGHYLDAPPETGVIAITRIRSHFETGHITDADIIFNGRDFRFSASDDDGDRLVNLKDVAIHEIGHLLGLEHTPLDGPPHIRPTMNPFNHSDDSGDAQSLEPDDIAGVSFLYPAIGYQATVGSIAGQIRDFDQQPLFGTHIKAENLDTGELFSTVSGAEPSAATVGHYRLHGLTPGRYRLSLAPIAGAITEENFGGVFTDFVTGFPAEFYDNARDDAYARVLDLAAAQHIDDVDFITDFAVPGYPFIVPIAIVSNTPDTQGPYPVSVAARDAASVWLLYQIDGGGSVEHLQMQQQDSLFVAQIPGQHVGTRITYQIEAHGADGKVSYFPYADAWLDFTVVELTGAPLAFTALRGDDAIGVVDTDTHRELARIPVGDEPIQVLLAGDQLFVSNLSSNDLRVIDTATFQVQAHIKTAVQPLDLALSPDGKTLYATNSGTSALTIVDVESSQARTVSLTSANEGLYGVAATADKIFTTDIAGSQVLVLSPQGHITGRRIPVPPKPRSLALAPDGKTLYVTSMDTGRLTAIDADGATVSRSIDLGVSGTFAIAPSPDGRKLYLTAYSEGSLLVVDAASGTLRKKLAIGRNPRAIAFSPDGTQVYVTSSFSNEIHIVDAVADTIVGHYATGQNPRGIALAQPVWPVAIAQPTRFAFAPTFPNPFNGSTQITYTLATDILVELRVYNALGQTVRTLLHQYREAGTHQIHWDGKDDRGRVLASGTYLLIMRAGPVRQATKMLLLR